MSSDEVMILRSRLEETERRFFAAEARVRELGEKYDAWIRLYAEQGGRLRAVTEAADAMRAFISTRRPRQSVTEYDDALCSRIDQMLAAYDAARSADLPPHPDTAYLQALEEVCSSEQLAAARAAKAQMPVAKFAEPEHQPCYVAPKKEAK